MPVKKLPTKKKKEQEEIILDVLPTKERRKSFFKRKTTYIIPAVLIIIIGVYFWSQSNGTADQYELFEVERIDLKRTVEVTGEIKPASRLELAFERNGTVDSIHVNIGDEVEEGDILAELEDEDVQFAYRTARASLSTTQARLDLEIAGEKIQTIQKAEASVEQAEADVMKAETDLANTGLTTKDDVRTAEIAVQTALNNLNNKKDQLEQNVDDAYDDAIVIMANALGPLDSSLSEGDRIIGVDDTTTNVSYRNLLGVSSAGSMERAKNSYNSAKPIKSTADSLVRNLYSESSNESIETAADGLLRALSLVQTYLTDVQNVLSGTITGAALTATDLSTMKTKVASERSTLSTQYTNVQNAIQSITSSKLDRTETSQTLDDAYETAKLNLNIAKTNAETSVRAAETAVTVKEAALSSAEADLELKRSPPRNVDLEPLRASVSEARVKLDQAESDLKKIQIIAPIDGTVSDILPELGEQVTMNDPAVLMISSTMFDIESLVPEADIALVKVGQDVTVTLDAYGDDLEFKGSVVSEDPDQTVIQDAVYYKSRISFDIGDRELKPGMTANVTILTSKTADALVIPTRAIRTDDVSGEKVVLILKNGDVKEVSIKVGLRGDEGRIAVTQGLSEGDTIIVSEK
jgi:HlyD family secretion protein